MHRLNSQAAFEKRRELRAVADACTPHRRADIGFGQCGDWPAVRECYTIVTLAIVNGWVTYFVDESFLGCPLFGHMVGGSQPCVDLLENY